MTQRLRGFYIITQDIRDIDMSISYACKALEICSEKYSLRAKIFYNLAEALFTRHYHMKKVEDLEEALQNFDKCLKILPNNNYLKAEYLFGFGLAQLRKLELLCPSGKTPESEMHPMLNEIIGQFKAAALEATSSPIAFHFCAAFQWAINLQRWNPEAALEAYDHVIKFLPRLKSMGTKLIKRQKAFKFSKTDGASRNAALNAITVRRYDKAVEFLKAGHAVFWQQILQLCIPTNELREAAPELEAKFSQISAELDKGTLRKEVQALGSHEERLMQEEEIVQLGDLNEE
ncbi:hypothetical protein BDQ17DRAFT_1502777 [Cyathus striatus]|nr:hypothetical protein BDQ17DRAFT_1502777 [Cyathus striatus]